MSKGWKYLIDDVPTSAWGGFKREALQELLDKRGREGWELINIVHAMPGMSSPTLVFKKAT